MEMSFSSPEVQTQECNNDEEEIDVVTDGCATDAKKGEDDSLTEGGAVDANEGNVEVVKANNNEKNEEDDDDYIDCKIFEDGESLNDCCDETTTDSDSNSDAQ